MDQFYWYVDEDTLIGYQWPVALVAIKPERVVMEPVLVWDYGFIPEAAPTAPRHFIGDSDDFFMLEPQKRYTGENMVRLGWISTDDIARNLSKWTTREQRECGKQLLVFHAGPLPAGLDTVIDESREYMSQVYSRLDPTPKSHIGHSWLGPWFDGAKYRMRGRPADGKRRGLPALAPAHPEHGQSRLHRLATAALQKGYAILFGRLPDDRPASSSLDRHLRRHREARAMGGERQVARLVAQLGGFALPPQAEGPARSDVAADGDRAERHPTWTATMTCACASCGPKTSRRCARSTSAFARRSGKAERSSSTCSTRATRSSKPTILLSAMARCPTATDRP